MSIKNIQYVLYLLLAVVLSAGCKNQEVLFAEDTENDKVNWRIGVTIPGSEMTDSRSFGSTDFEFDDLYVAVFVEAGGDYYFEELVKAANTAPEWNEANGCWDFNVALSKTNGPRRLHLIGNYPDLTMGFGEEGQLVGRLITNKTNGGHDVYWNCVEVQKIDEGFEQEVQKVPLVRNYVKIMVNVNEELWSDFEMTGYALYYVPQWGTVAPYNSKDGSFANFVAENNVCQSYQYMFQEEEYEGNEPNDDGGLFSQELQWVEVSEDHTIPPYYMYERSNRLAKTPTSMIVKGKYKQGEESYYKLDFVYRDDVTGANVYYNLLRNFVYTMNINHVVGHGYSSVNEAINNPASNNMGGDAIAKDYTNISDGVGRLFVSSTYLVLTNDQAVDVYYQYIPDLDKDISAADYVKNEDVVVSAPEGNVLRSSGQVATSDETSGTRNKWRKVTLYPKSPTAVAQSQTITFAADGLQRDIEILLRNPYDMSVVVNPDWVEAEKQSEVNVKISIPNGIGESLFPLYFFISSEDNTIYPVPGKNMPTEVRNGKYGFIKELTLEEYKQATVESDGWISFVCEFLTNCDNSATTVYVDNEYFSRASDLFVNPWKNEVSLGTSIGVDIQIINGRYPQAIYNSGRNNGTKQVTVTLNGSNVGTITIDRDNVTKGITFKDNAGLFTNDVVEFTFTDNYWHGQWSEMTYKAVSTLGEIDGGTTLEFIAQGEINKLTTIEITTSQKVSVPKSGNRYPEKIYNNGWNNGTEQVIVTLNGTEVGRINVDSDNVTQTATLQYDGGFDYADELKFTFSDKYRSGKDWVGPATFTAKCTVEQLISGTATLQFSIE